MAEKIGSYRVIAQQIDAITKSKLDVRNQSLGKLMSQQELQKHAVQKGSAARSVFYDYGSQGKLYEVTPARFRELQKATTKAVRAGAGKRGWKPFTLWNRMEKSRKSKMAREITGIARITAVRKNMVRCKVGKSRLSTYVPPYHQVTIRFEDWDAAMTLPNPDGSFVQNILWAMKQDVSVDCDCEDYQYRLRYWNWKKGFSITEESAPPKITNPGDEKGSLCIHSGRTIRTILNQKPTFVKRLADEMKRQAGEKHSQERDEEVFLDEKAWLKKQPRSKQRAISRIADSAKKAQDELEAQIRQIESVNKSLSKQKAKAVEKARKLNEKIRQIEKDNASKAQKIKNLQKQHERQKAKELQRRQKLESDYNSKLKNNLKMMLKYTPERQKSEAIEAFATMNNIPVKQAQEWAKS